MFRRYQAATMSTTSAMIVRIGMERIELVPRARNSFGKSDALMRLLPVHSTLMPR